LQNRKTISELLQYLFKNFSVVGCKLNLLFHYASLVTENAEQFKFFSKYIVADAFFSKRPFVKKEQSAGLEFISRLRDDSVLMYKFTGDRTGKKGAPKKFDGLVDAYNFNPDRFSLDFSNEEITIYSLVVYSKAFKMDIKLAMQFFTKTEERQQENYFSLLI